MQNEGNLAECGGMLRNPGVSSAALAVNKLWIYLCTFAVSESNNWLQGGIDKSEYRSGLVNSFH